MKKVKLVRFIIIWTKNLNYNYGYRTDICILLLTLGPFLILEIEKVKFRVVTACF